MNRPEMVGCPSVRVQQYERDEGKRLGLTSDEKAELRDMEREDLQLKRLVADLTLYKQVLQGPTVRRD